jgi:Domain of unknown function (DUF4349)
VDTDAKIKNLTGFRDNLRTMLAKPSATIRDSVEIQQQLTEVQSQLDSETAQRKLLAKKPKRSQWKSHSGLNGTRMVLEDLR